MFLLHTADFHFQKCSLFHNAKQFRTSFPFYENTHNAVLHFNHLFDFGNYPNLVQPFNLRIVFLDIPLRHQEYILLSHHGFFYGPDGSASAHVKMRYHSGQNRHTPQRHRRERHHYVAQFKSPFQSVTTLHTASL